MNRKRIAGIALAGLLAVLLLMQCMSAIAEADTRWADASDEIDKFLDTAFEDYLAGNADAAYQNVSNAYFRVYETTGFERQTMSYISGNRKNAVEMQFSNCKAAVKKDNTEQDTRVSVRTALVKLKDMIREDANKLASQQGGAQSEMKWYKGGEMVSSDPYPEYSADPNAAVKYESWYEAATLVKELLDTAYMGYLDKDFTAAADNLETAYYSVYEESGLSHRIYTDLSLDEREKMDAHYDVLRGLIGQGEEKYQKNKYRTSTDKAKNDILKLAKKIDVQEEEAKTATQPETEEVMTQEPEKQSDPRWLTFLAAFGIIVREGLEAILVIAAIIAYLIKSGNAKTLKNVYLGALLGVAASFVAAGGLYMLKCQQLDDLEGGGCLLEPVHRREGSVLGRGRKRVCPGIYGVLKCVPGRGGGGAVLPADAFRGKCRNGLGRLFRRMCASCIHLSGDYEAVDQAADQGILHRNQHSHGSHVRQLPGKRDQRTGGRKCI